MEESLRQAAAEASGFMPEAEGLALHEAAATVAGRGPLLEVGSYCGKSAIYLGAAARSAGSVVFSIDHHRGSEEHQPGETYHDPALVDADGLVDTLGAFRRAIRAAGLEDTVVGIVGRSERVAAHWATPLALTFIDGSHSPQAAARDYEGWSPHVMSGGLLVIHDVFDDSTEGGRPPFEIYMRALRSGSFREVTRCRSLRVLKRVDDAG